MTTEYIAPTDTDAVRADVVNVLRDIIKYGTDKRAARLPGIVAMATKLVEPLAGIDLTSTCPVCASRHADTCPLHNPPATSRDAMIADATDRINATIEDPELRGYAIAGKTAAIDAMFVCNCDADKPATSTGTGDNAPRVRKSELRLTYVWNTGDAKSASAITFTLGSATNTFDLPADANADSAYKALNKSVVAWVAGNGGSTPGQTNMATKIIRQHRYA